MELFLYWLSAIVLAGLAVWLARLWGRTRSLAALCALIVTAGLVYDNGIIAAGSLIGAGPLLEALNWPRYVIHAFATPLLIVAGLDFARRARLGWAQQRGWQLVLLGVAAAMIVYGVVFELLPLSLVAESEGGIVSYGPEGGASMPVPALVTMVVLTAVGVALWVARGWSWLTISSLLAVAGFGLAPALEFEVLGQIAEVVLIGGIAMTERWLAQQHS